MAVEKQPFSAIFMIHNNNSQASLNYDSKQNVCWRDLHVWSSFRMSCIFSVRETLHQSV